MGVRKVTLAELDAAVQAFLTEVRKGEPIMVEDDAGRAIIGVIPYTEATEQEKRDARERLSRLQKKVREQMERRGGTEEELDRILQEDE